MAEIVGKRDKRKIHIIGILPLVILLFLFCLTPTSVGIIILLFPLSLIFNSKTLATLAVTLIGISLIAQQFTGALVYAFLTGIVGLKLALIVTEPLSQFGIGLLIAALGMIVPLIRRITRTSRAAITDVSGHPSSEVDKTEPRIYDLLRLRNGDNLSGTILNESFTIQTTYTTLSFPKDDIKRILFESEKAETQTMELRRGDILRGVIKDDVIDINIPSAEKITIEKDKIQEVNFAEKDTKEQINPKNPTS